jgi:hypothetical protein
MHFLSWPNYITLTFFLQEKTNDRFPGMPFIYFIFIFASGGQGGSFYKNRPPGPPAKIFINFFITLNEKLWEVSEGAGSPALLNMLLTI